MFTGFGQLSGSLGVNPTFYKFDIMVYSKEGACARVERFLCVERVLATRLQSLQRFRVAGGHVVAALSALQKCAAWERALLVLRGSALARRHVQFGGTLLLSISWWFPFYPYPARGGSTKVELRCSRGVGSVSFWCPKGPSCGQRKANKTGEPEGKPQKGTTHSK